MTKWKSVISPCGFRKIGLQNMLNILCRSINIPFAIKIKYDHQYGKPKVNRLPPPQKKINKRQTDQKS